MSPPEVRLSKPAMVSIGLEYVVRKGKDREFIEVTRRTIASLKNVAGHSSSRLFQDVDDPHTFLVYSEWASSKEYQAFLRSDVFTATQSLGREELLATRPRHTVFLTAAGAEDAIRPAPHGSGE